MIPSAPSQERRSPTDAQCPHGNNFVMGLLRQLTNVLDLDVPDSATAISITKKRSRKRAQD